MIRMKMRDKYCDTGQRNFSLRESNGRAPSGVKNQLLFTGLDQRRRAELIRVWLRGARTEESDADGFGTSDAS